MNTAEKTWDYIERLLTEECGLRLDEGLNQQRQNCINAIAQGRPDLETELGRAYRALHGFYAVFARGEPPNKAMLGYHSTTIAAAARFVNGGSLDGSKYFEGKSVDVLHDALKPQ